MSDDADRVRELLDRQPDLMVEIPGTGRVLAADIDGRPDGTPVVLLHGTPDSRLARHPEGSIARALGIRLIAIDRPGFGYSSSDPTTTPVGFGHDLNILLDDLGIASAALLAWSAGTIWALGAASVLGDRVRSVTAVGGLVPFEAFTDPHVRAAAGAARLGMVETAEELGADLAAEMIAPLLVPDPVTPAAALEHRAEAGDDALSDVTGADIQMAAACCDAVRGGLGGLTRDVTVQFTDSGVDFDAIGARSRFITGANDATCPPVFAYWYAGHVPDGTAQIITNAGHGLLLTHWRSILSQIVDA